MSLLAQIVRGATTLASTISAFVAQAEVPSICKQPGRAAGQVMGKDEVAAWALDEAHVPRRLERLAQKARAARPVLTGLTDREVLVVLGPDLCSSGACEAADQQLLFNANDVFRGLLRHPDVQTAYREVATIRFFTEPALTVACSKVDVAATLPTPSPTPASPATPTPAPADGRLSTWVPLRFDPELVRVRGASEDLIFARGEAGYAEVDKAKLSFSNDQIDGKRALGTTLAVGMPFDIWRGGNGALTHYERVSIIPFAATDIGYTRKDGEKKEFSARHAEFGAIVELLRSDRSPGQSIHRDSYVALTPKYGINYDEGSAVISMNALVRPFLTKGLNSLTRLGESGITAGITFNLRLNSGHFTRTGAREPERSQDFSRLGGEIGLSMSSAAGFAIPFDGSVSQTVMAGLRGSPGTLNLLKAELGLYTSDEKTIGLNLSFSRGRDEDLDDSVRKFEIGLGFKY